ncbi:iron(III) transport system ATP-binding protein/putative spermidine/putrescine transport system ATP-binding protein [Paenibacillus phyllosphaerae]|uniref:Carnitine transport ATP-binding protein OpuCA n=1 Tax=Paenibacillus phyllosphaerae TaxID=274593 RepID=A0A7W5FKL6_9BACL|nr:ABC transporter ATP-binding protein [Paenibacillus phyllosphaerae]MBB3108295.1 iron(III) transport system ATP-binding protein/putative spermidine/putrescine transport system ATP-binding protein [Paenibacillus phyllosphaerae]
MKSILEADRLSKSFGNHTALSEISFEVHAGEIISVLGPSGCGKSTLLQLIAGLTQPDGGEIRMRGKTIASRSQMVPPEKRGMNMVFQDYALWPHMSVYDNMAYGMRRQKASASVIAAQLEELMELLHLKGLERRLPPQLSGGQQQRVAIARALATKPDLLLLDEPLSNLDQGLRIEMRTEMAYLFRKLGTTVFHVTHDPDEAFSMADRLIIMRAGGIDQIARPEACYKLPATRSAARLLGAGNQLKGKLTRIGQHAVVRVDGMELTGTATTDWKGSAGDDVVLLLRPDVASWLGQAAIGYHAAELETAAALEPSTDPAGSGNRLPAAVLHSVFEGKHWRVLAEAGDGQKLSFLHERKLEAGERGSLIIPPSHLFVYPT